MDINNITLGFDIATSVSIIAAVISFWISQSRTRKQTKNIYIANQLKEIIDLLSEKQIKATYLLAVVGNLIRFKDNPDRQKDFEKIMDELSHLYADLIITIRLKVIVLKEMDDDMSIRKIIEALSNISNKFDEIESPEELPHKAPDLKDEINNQIGALARVVKDKLAE